MARRKRVHSDGWENLFTKMGDPLRDKRLGAYFGLPPTFQRQELENLFHGNDLANRIARLPAEEMTRQWIELCIDAMDGEDQAGAQARQAAVKATQQSLQTLGAQAKICEAKTWARNYGGSIIYIAADGGPNDDPAEPLPEKIQAVRYLTVFDRFEVMPLRDSDRTSPTYGQVSHYQILTVPRQMHDAGEDELDVGAKLHASRCIRFDGTLTSRKRRWGYNQGWADSVFVKLYELLRGYGTTWAGVEALMQDFAQAVIKLKGLAEMMAQNGEDAVKARLELMDLSRSILRAMVMDADGEEFSRTATPLTGLPELLDRWMYRVSSAVGIPVTLLFGMSPGGMNATGASDIRLFYDSIHAQQESELRPQIEQLLRILMRSAEGPTGGAEPEGWSFKFCPLWQMPETDKATLRKTVAETDAIYITNQVVSPDEIAASRFGGDGYSMETSLHTEARQAMAEAEGQYSPNATESVASGENGPMNAGATFDSGQLKGTLDVIKAVAGGEISRESGQAILELAFQLKPEDAVRLLGPDGFKAEKPEPPMPPAGNFGKPPVPSPAAA